MLTSYQLRSITPSDHVLVREIYAEAIESHAEPCYTSQQKDAWVALAWLPGVLDEPLNKGRGWLSFESNESAAFAVRFPPDRLALLYCRGRFSRRGHATFLLNHLELGARIDGQVSMVTEASYFGHSFLLSRGWIVQNVEIITIGGVYFQRYRMQKFLH